MTGRMRGTMMVLLTGLLSLNSGLLSGQGAAPSKDTDEFANWHKLQQDDADQLRKKIVSLARAVPADKLGWRPMDGARSFHEVLAHIAAEGFTEPTSFGRPLPKGSLADFDAEEARLKALPDNQLITALDQSLGNLSSTVAGLTLSRANEPMKFWGEKTYPRGAVAMALSDLHEHLGQLVAYARMNKIVPPWSRKT